MGTSSADPERLADYAQATGEAREELAAAARQLSDLLERFNAAPCEMGGPVLDHGQQLQALVERAAELDRFVGEVGRAFAAVDRREELLMRGGGWPSAVTASFDEVERWRDAFGRERPEAVAEMVEQLREWLAGGWLGVTRRDLDQIRALVADMPQGQLDAVFRSLSDQDLRRLVEVMRDSWVPGYGWDRPERHAFWILVGSRVDLETLRRIARFTDDLDPPPAQAGDDTASGRSQDQAWYDALVYVPLDGSLLWRGRDDPHPVDFSDLTQGRIGNCYLIAALMAIARSDPGRLARLITTNPNGTYTVTFADGMQVLVTSDFPVHPDQGDRPAFASRSLAAERRDPATGFELWPLVLEKAYAQRHGGWGEIVGGWPGPAITELVGGETRRIPHDEVTLDLLRRALHEGHVVTYATVPASRASEDGQALFDRDRWLAPQHAYVVTRVLPSGRVELVNPWHPQDGRLRMPLDDLLEAAWEVEVNELP